MISGNTGEGDLHRQRNRLQNPGKSHRHEPAGTSRSPTSGGSTPEPCQPGIAAIDAGNLISGNRTAGSSRQRRFDRPGQHIGTDLNATEPLGTAGASTSPDHDGRAHRRNRRRRSQRNRVEPVRRLQRGPRNAIRANPIILQRAPRHRQLPGRRHERRRRWRHRLKPAPELPLDFVGGLRRDEPHGPRDPIDPEHAFDIDVFESPSCTPRPRSCFRALTSSARRRLRPTARATPPSTSCERRDAPLHSAGLADGDGSLGQHLRVLAEGPLRFEPALGTAGGRRDREPHRDPLRRGCDDHLRRRGGLESVRHGRDRDDRHGPDLPAATVNDIQVTNTDGTSGLLEKAWIADFLDEPPGQQFYYFVTTLVSNAVTVGVGSSLYGTNADPPPADGRVPPQGPSRHLLRAASLHRDASPTSPALRLRELDRGARRRGDHRRMRHRHLLSAEPGAARPDGRVSAEGQARPELHAASLQRGFCRRHLSIAFANWIEQLAAEGITGGCGNGNYCPLNPVPADRWPCFSRRRSTSSSAALSLSPAGGGEPDSL